MEKLEKQAAQLGDYFERLMIYIVQAQANTSSGLSDLSKQESNVIFILGERGSLIMRELAESLRLHVSTMTGVVDKLAEKQFVTRERSEKDRRIVRVALTKKGTAAYEQEAEKRKQLSLAMLNPLEATERDTLLKLFDKIMNKVENSRN